MRKRIPDRRGGVRWVGPWTVLLFLAPLLTNCDFLDELVDVTAPDRIVAETLETPANVQILMAGAVGDFECGLAHYIVGTGMTADEIQVTDALTAVEMYDSRNSEPRGLGSAYAQSTCDGFYQGIVGVYRPISTARWQADNLLNLLEGWTDAEVEDRAFYMAKAAAYAGYSYLLLGESMCQASIDLSAPMTPNQLWALAEERFTEAIGHAQSAGAAADEFLNMARVGRARTLLNLARASEAAADARLVPSGFVKSALYSTVGSRRWNRVYNQINERIDMTVEPPFRDLMFEGVLDPRAPTVFTGQITEGVNIELWDQLKYSSRSSSIPIARWEEAQLIIAEAELDDGNLQAAVDIINDLHPAGLPDFASSNANEIRNQIIYERSAELFLEGHRLGDMKRYSVPLVPPPGAPYHAGGVYGDGLCYPYPGLEIDGNPNSG